VSEKSMAGESGNGTAITLGLLAAVEQDSSVTQRRLATDLGIALGLANSYLKRCVKKGLIKVGEAPANRYAYYLTPQGFAEKSRLTAEYLSHSFQFFRSARLQCAEVFDDAIAQGWQSIVLYGASELAEIASLNEVAGLEVVGVIDPDYTGPKFAGLPVYGSPEEAPPFDALMLTAMHDAQSKFNKLCSEYSSDRILTPPLLRVVRDAARVSASGGAAP
jgi:DNA-binding MarR family transcriptional regulator